MKKKRSSLISYFVFLIIFGVVSTVINSDFPLGALIQNWKDYDIKSLLDTLNLGLGFLVFVLLTGFFFYRVIRQGNDQDSKNPWEDEAE